MSDYIKLFNSKQDQTDFANSTNYILPHVSCTVDGGNLKYSTVDLEPVDIGISGFYVANCNLGAIYPMDLGDSFAWGEITPKETYTWDNYKWGTSDNLTKYNSTDNKTELDRADDAATVVLGEHWRLPTFNEFKKFFTSTGVNVEDNTNYIKLTNNTTGAYIIIPKSDSYLTSTLYSDFVKYRNMSSRGVANVKYRYEKSYIRPIYIP